MTTTIDELLATLHSDKARLVFLHRIYEPGRSDVADRIISLEKADNTILDEEIQHALATRNNARLQELGRRKIDYYIQHDYARLIKREVCAWGSHDLAHYAIAELIKNFEGHYEELEVCVEIAEHFNDETTRRQVLEKALAIYVRNESICGREQTARTLERLGRYDEAIDKWCSCETYGRLPEAMDIAKKHAPHKIREVAQKGFERFCDDYNCVFYAEFYVECAEILQKTEEARQTLVQYAQRKIREDNIHSDINDYSGLLRSLIRFNEKQLAEDFVEKAHNKDTTVAALFVNAEHYHAIGNNQRATEMYKTYIERVMKTKGHPPDWLKNIDVAFETTRDLWFLERKREVLEILGRYDEASKVAIQLNNPQLAEHYKAMQTMIRAARGAP